MIFIDLLVDLYLVCEEFCIIFMCVPVILLFVTIYPSIIHKNKVKRNVKRIKNVPKMDKFNQNNKNCNKIYH